MITSDLSRAGPGPSVSRASPVSGPSAAMPQDRTFEAVLGVGAEAGAADAGEGGVPVDFQPDASLDKSSDVPTDALAEIMATFGPGSDLIAAAGVEASGLVVAAPPPEGTPETEGADAAPVSDVDAVVAGAVEAAIGVAAPLAGAERPAVRAPDARAGDAPPSFALAVGNAGSADTTLATRPVEGGPEAGSSAAPVAPPIADAANAAVNGEAAPVATVEPVLAEPRSADLPPADWTTPERAQVDGSSDAAQSPNPRLAVAPAVAGVLGSEKAADVSAGPADAADPGEMGLPTATAVDPAVQAAPAAPPAANAGVAVAAAQPNQPIQQIGGVAVPAQAATATDDPASQTEASEGSSVDADAPAAPAPTAQATVAASGSGPADVRPFGATPGFEPGLLEIGGAEWRLAAGETVKPAGDRPHPAMLATPREVAGQITLAVSNATQPQIEIRLDPPELGRVQIRLNPSEGGGVHAVVLAERPETQDFLRRNAETLIRDLSESGYSGVTLEFAAGGDAAPRDDAPEGRRYGRSYDPAPAIAAVAEGRRGGADSALDIRL